MAFKFTSEIFLSSKKRFSVLIVSVEIKIDLIIIPNILYLLFSFSSNSIEFEYNNMDIKKLIITRTISIYGSSIKSFIVLNENKINDKFILFYDFV
jgi:hypothetical protein